LLLPFDKFPENKKQKATYLAEGAANNFLMHVINHPLPASTALSIKDS
jgi:hypothetical protein